MRKKLQDKKKQWMEWLTGLFVKGKELIKTVREHMAELSREQELEERKIQALKRMIRYAGELLLVLFVFCTLMQHVWIGQVQGASMRPTYQDGQFVLLLRAKEKEYNRGDVVGVEYTAGEEKSILLKRIIAIGGDVVSCKSGQLSMGRKYQNLIIQWENPRILRHRRSQMDRYICLGITGSIPWTPEVLAV